MKEFILIAINLILTLGLVLYIYDSSKDYLRVGSQLQCLDFKSHQLCAQCLSRSPQLNLDKGFLINSKNHYAGLKIAHKQELISCKQSLHLIDYENNHGPAVLFQRQQAIGQLINELQISPIYSVLGKHVIQPKYESFMVFGWYSKTDKKGVEIAFPNDNSKQILKIFFYLLNAIVLIIIIGKLILNQDEKNKPGSYFLIILIFGLQLIVSSNYASNSHIIIALVRVIYLTLPLIRVYVKTIYICAYFCVGLFMSLHPLSLAIYSYLGWLLAMIGGWDKLNIKPLWIYLMVSQFIVAINYQIWSLAYRYEADTPNRIIQLTQIIITILAFAFLTDQKAQNSKEYSSGESKPIYLKEYDQQTEIIVRK